jgi:hypothetical protein
LFSACFSPRKRPYADDPWASACYLSPGRSMPPIGLALNNTMRLILSG